APDSCTGSFVLPVMSEPATKMDRRSQLHSGGASPFAVPDDANAKQPERPQLVVIRPYLRSPRKTESVSGAAANEMGPLLCELANRNPSRADVPLEPALLKRISLRHSHEPEGSAGDPVILRQIGHIYWPFALRGATQQRLDELLKQVATKALAGELDPALH